MKYYLFQTPENAVVWKTIPRKPDIIVPSIVLKCSWNKTPEQHLRNMLAWYSDGINVSEISSYDDFKMESDSLDKIIEYAALESL